MANYKIRREWYRTQIDTTNHWPSAKEIKAKFPATSLRSAYRDIDAIYNEFRDPNSKERVKTKVWKRLNKRVEDEDFDDRYLVRLAVADMPAKSEVTADIEMKRPIRIVWGTRDNNADGENNTD